MKNKLKQKMKLASGLLSNPLITKLRSAGLLNEIQIRNYKIISDYLKMRKSFTQLDAIYQIADKYFISPDRVHDILFKKRKISKPPLIN